LVSGRRGVVTTSARSGKKRHPRPLAVWWALDMAARKRSPAAPAEPIPQPEDFALAYPIEPMLAKASDGIPSAEGLLFEPKWDGFRAIVFRRGDKLYIQSRELKPLDRYFPELHTSLLSCLPDDCVLDGEVVIAGANGLDFDALQMRIHPAASRVQKLAEAMPSSYVAFDALSLAGEDLRALPLAERRERLEAALQDARAPLHLTPITRDHALATEWLARFEGAGLDGVMAKREDQPYQPGKRAMIKIKHARTAECVVAGFRWHKNGPGTLIGSLLLGLYNDEGKLQHVGVTSSFTMAARAQLVEELAPLRETAVAEHPWKEWAGQEAEEQRMPGAQSRWSNGKDLSWEPLRIERVCEVKYDHLQGDRFRHAATFQRWRLDKSPQECRYDQLEVTTPFELASVFGASER
jgi:ATP-dependent DNA ligase